MNIIQNERPSRLSKIRAIMAIKQAVLIDSDEDDTDNENKKKLNKNDKSKRSGRKTKAQILLEDQYSQRLKRKNVRSQIDGEALMDSLTYIKGNNCCLLCSTNSYRGYLETGSYDEFKYMLESYEKYPSYTHEDKTNGLDLIEYSFILKKFEFAELAAKISSDKTFNKRPNVPKKYLTYDDNTGHNYGVGTYSKRAFRQVQESRGNRLGNSAFYKDRMNKTSMNLEDSIKNCEIRPFIHYITRDVFKDVDVIENFLVRIQNPSLSVYFAIISGNRILAHMLIEEANKVEGRTTFNHLHHEVLKFDATQPLSNYRKTQILKSAFDACNVTPYHCSAIHSSTTYLAEFYEALDTAERLQTDLYGRTVAFYAAVSETTACLEYLLSKNFNMIVYDKYKLTPLIQAARFGRSHNVEFLIKHMKGDDKSIDEVSSSIYTSTAVKNRRTALHYAAFFGHADTCKVLIEYNAPVDIIENLDKQTPLHFAVRNGHYDCVQILIEEGNANPEKVDKYLRTPLHLACIFGHLQIAYYLLSLGVDANSTDSSGNSPTHYAAAFGYQKILKLLIYYGLANPNTSNLWRSTPCSIASMKGHLGIIKYLLTLPDNPINVNFKDQDGYIMLQYAISEPVNSELDIAANLNKIKLLISMKSNVNSSDIEGIEYILKIARILIEAGSDLTIQNLEKETPLSTAMKHHNHFLVALLIDAGAKFWEDTYDKGNNFFHYFGKLAAYANSFQPHCEEDAIRQERFVNVAKMIWNTVEAKWMPDIRLINAINAFNHEGYTPILYSVHQAVYKQKQAMIREKQLIYASVPNKSYGFSGCSDDRWYPSEKFNAYKERPIQVTLMFDFSIFIQLMKSIIIVAKPNLNATIKLPKDYKNNISTTKKKDYPRFTGFSALHLACKTQNVDLIRFLLQYGANANSRIDIEGWLDDTPIMVAYHRKEDLLQEQPNNKTETIELIKKTFTIIKPDFKLSLYQTIQTLIEFNAYPYITNASGDSALFRASVNMDVENLQLMCSRMRNTMNGNEYDNTNTKNKMNQTVLMTAINSIQSFDKAKEHIYISIINCLLQIKADPNFKYKDSDTILMKAIKIPYPSLVRTLLENSRIHIDHNYQNKKHETALLIACKLNEVDIINIYLDYLHNLKEDVSFNVNHFDDAGCSPLSYVCRNGNKNAAQLLLNLGADPNFCKVQSIPLIEAIKSGHLDLVKVLLERGAIVIDQSDINGNSPLHHAVLVQKHRMTDLLLEYNADFKAVNHKNQTPLHLAIEMTKRQTNRSFRVERSLIQMGADANVLDYLGRTPLHYIFVNNQTIPLIQNNLIISKKVNQMIKEIQEQKEKESILNDYINQFDLVDDETSSIGQINEWMKNAKMTQIHQEYKAKKALEIKDDETIFVSDEEKASLNKYLDCEWETELDIPERSDPIDILKYLSGCKAIKFDIQDEFGRTPLHYAACIGAFSCSTFLIEKKVDINTFDLDNNGSFQLALRNNHIDYSVMLCNYGADINSKITLKDGKRISTFDFSLSMNLINISYLILDKSLSLLEYIRDALKNGKFHMVEVLLYSVDTYALSKTLSDEEQNMWHILASFKPFDSEIWHDYLDNFISKIALINLGLDRDKYGRTPLHYASKYGQYRLLQYLVENFHIVLNIIDEDGKSELDYAVESCEIQCVEILLHKGCHVNKPTHISKHKSVLLVAVEKSQYEIANLLLQNGALTDDNDSVNGWSNSVMIACLKKDLKMLQILINYNVDLNRPSPIERTDKAGNTYKVVTYPLIVASSKLCATFLEVLLKAGANPNVYEPETETEKGMSCFMYNVALNSIENQQMLLKYNINLDLVDPYSMRTLFYEFFFENMSPNQCLPNNINRTERLVFHDSIYQEMLKSCKPNVNTIDPITGMTPLELAIIKRNIFLVKHLISLGASPNIESCCNYSNDISTQRIMNPSRKKLPAFLHAIMQSNLEILTSVCEASTEEINWMWHDDEGNTIFSYMIGIVSGYSNLKKPTLNYIASQMGNEIFNYLLQTPNNHGISPILYAYHYHQKSQVPFNYSTLLSLSDPSFENFAVENYNAEKFIHSEQNLSKDIDINYISASNVEKDAQIERKRLQQLKNIEQNKKRDSLNNDTVDDALRVDPYSKLDKVGYIIVDEHQVPYDIMLMKVELQSWGCYTDTSFYKLSIIYNKILDIYILWTRWGPFGKEGQHQKTPFLTKESAIEEFKLIFKSKTRNSWDHHRSSFVAKPGRYEIMQKSNHPKDIIIEDFDFLKSSNVVPTKLPSDLFHLLKLICNYHYLSRVYMDTNIDMPLGQIPSSQIEEARKILSDTLEMIQVYNELRKCYSDKSKIMESKVYQYKIAQKCVEYSRILPQSVDSNQPIRSLYNNELILSEISKVDDLNYIGFAANIILAAKHNMNIMHPLDYAYRALNCSLRSISSNRNLSEYQLVKSYMESTANESYELVHLFAIQHHHRQEEEEEEKLIPFRRYENSPHRKLLWHGSRVGNFMGILKQGLRSTPAISSFTGSLLGNGVYFADTFSKSIKYAKENYDDKLSGYMILLLCEVSFDDQVNQIDPLQLETRKGQGKYIPDPENELYDKDGVSIPIGPCIPFAASNSIAPNDDHHPHLLHYNEYCILNTDRIKPRYLLIVKDSNCCYLCSKAAIGKPLFQHDLSSYDYHDFNMYEAEIIKASLTNNLNKSPQEIFNENISHFYKEELYKKHWDIPIELHRESKICNDCAHKVASIILEDYFKNNSHYVLSKYTHIHSLSFSLIYT
ncbi:ankyrin repeat-containing domain protein [Cokeromyces recurvatus]|uniref:ankyrin repeat-containing domain protein n=1 Tax=Cokeromyces recurvatus TaxID=90255 RepID=UPI002220EB91|nr:ankyrin repeat-containing domain protein [Cokeromyces recurvatus]KAI7902907.1 ankyrin repeat-containing domain protein [Cokeromyces recurvatus]